jgi:hypothetical protein
MIIESDPYVLFVDYYVSPLNTARAIDAIEAGFLHWGHVSLRSSHCCHYFFKDR